MKLSYITNIKSSEQSGGASGLNSATIKELEKHFEIETFLPINPGIEFIPKIRSKTLRLIGLKGNYFFFSENRLNRIKDKFKKINNESIPFFYGFTPWIKTSPQKIYFCFNDACFATYVKIYNHRQKFSKKDLLRIYNQEAEWLQNARNVFFTSEWALNETKTAYKLSGDNFINVGVGGFISPPNNDNYKSGYNFLFISREFIPKGGLVVMEAISIVRKRYPTAKVWVVGEKPPQKAFDNKGIIYKGFFDKSIKAEYNSLIEIFENSFALIHPTTKDTTTLVINELAYFGCPAIASNRFAIPEYLLDEKTGFLLNDPTDSDELAQKMIRMIEDKELYSSMRIETRKNALDNNTWDKVGERIAGIIQGMV